MVNDSNQDLNVKNVEKKKHGLNEWAATAICGNGECVHFCVKSKY